MQQQQKQKSGMDACRPIASLSVRHPFYSFIRQGKLLLHGHFRFEDILFVLVVLGVPVVLGATRKY